MSDFTEHERAVMARMTPEHQELMKKLTAAERKSLAQHVTPDAVDHIQSWIGTDEEIEGMLFWDRGGKFDDPEWIKLKPLDSRSADLMAAAESRFDALKIEAVESQRRSDLTLYSQFNTGLLFTGLAGAVRCGADGSPATDGEFYNGIEWRCVGSVEEHINSITIYPEKSGEYEVHFGGRINDTDEGILVYTADLHSLLQLAQLSEKTMPKAGFETRVHDPDGNEVELDPKVIRKAAMGG